MAKSWLIEVTEQDIEDAQHGDSFNCMVAEAIKRQVPGAKRVEVDLQTIRWSDKSGRQVFLTPYAAAGYIVAFDAGDEISPFEFQLRQAVKVAQRRPRTDGAKAVKAVDDKITNTRRKMRAAEEVVSSPDSSVVEIAEATAEVAELEEQVVELKQKRREVSVEYRERGEKVAPTRVSKATRKAPPRVFKSRSREYGLRKLRVNQELGRTHTVSRDS